jgi:hypothetical protein
VQSIARSWLGWLATFTIAPCGFLPVGWQQRWLFTSNFPQETSTNVIVFSKTNDVNQSLFMLTLQLLMQKTTESK